MNCHRARRHRKAWLLVAITGVLWSFSGSLAQEAMLPRLLGEASIPTFIDVLDFSPSGERFSCRLHPTQVPHPNPATPEAVEAWRAAQAEEDRRPTWLAVYPVEGGPVVKAFRGLYGSWHTNDVLYHVDFPRPLALPPIVAAPDVLDVRPIGLAGLLAPALEQVARAAWAYAETGDAPVTDLTALGLARVDNLDTYSQATTAMLGDYVPGPEPVAQSALRQIAAAATIYFTTESGRAVYPGIYAFQPTDEPLLARLPGHAETEPLAVPGVEGAWSFDFDTATGRALVLSHDRKTYATYRLGQGPEMSVPAFDEERLEEVEYQLVPGHDLLLATRTSLVDCPAPTAGPFVELRALDGTVVAALSTDVPDAEDRPRLYRIYASSKLIVLWLGRPVQGEFKHLLRIYAFE